MKHEYMETKYDVDDFLPWQREKLNELLKGDEDFRLDIEVRKECANAQIYGKKDDIEIRVEWYMDDLCDLIDDALCANDQEVESNKEWNEVLKAVEDADIHTICGSSDIISRDSSLEDVTKKLEALSYESYKDLDVEWANCKAIVRDFINARRAS